jgi:hypothetical protein
MRPALAITGLLASIAWNELLFALTFTLSLSARRKYYEEGSSYPNYYRENPRAAKFDAFVDASLTLLGWIGFGLLAAIAFLVWGFWRIALEES